MDEFALNIQEIIKDLKIDIWNDYQQSDIWSKENAYPLYGLSCLLLWKECRKGKLSVHWLLFSQFNYDMWHRKKWAEGEAMVREGKAPHTLLLTLQI